jgi:hypothetical protein
MIAQHLQLIISGDDVSPQTLSLHELNRWLTLYEKLLNEAHESEGEAALTMLESGSVALTFETHNPHHTALIDAVGETLQRGDFDRVPASVLKVLGDMRDLAAVRRRRLVFGVGSGLHRRTAAILDADTHIGQPRTYKSPTTIYGMLISIGGKKNPNLHIQRAGMNDVTCTPQGSLQERRSHLKRYSQFIYSDVKVEGIGVFSMHDSTLIELYIDQLSPRTQRPLLQVLRDVAEASDIRGQHIGDVMAYTRGLRDEE